LRSRYFFYIGRRTTVKGSIYVKDLVRCLDFLSGDGGSEVVYNAVFPEPYTIENIARTIQAVFGIRGNPPTVPYRPAVIAAYMMEFAASLGIRTPVHHRRIEKLYHSTYLSAQRLCDAGFRFQFDLRSAIEDWKRCSPSDQPC
jgi:NAD dependent epimerase/dehydratase family enzyme